MFDFFSWSHILVLLTAALVIVGPKDLPRLMHMAGKWAGKARGMANEFRRSFDEMARTTELEELRKEIEALKRNNPVADLEAEVARSVELPPDTPPDGESPAPRSGEFAITDSEAEAPRPEAPEAAQSEATQSEATQPEATKSEAAEPSPL
jgi:sec-independent protein translocase protein TatB